MSKETKGDDGMDYSKIMEELKDASLFELYRLSAAIIQQLEDPKRISEIRRHLRIGQIISYFDSTENRSIEAKVIKLKRTRLLVEAIPDKQRWDIPYLLDKFGSSEHRYQHIVSKKRVRQE